MRVAQNRFDLSENDRWAEPLDENLTRVLAKNLSVLLRTDRIVVYPWPIDKKPIIEWKFKCFASSPIQREKQNCQHAGR